jgi:hypothetical protein
VDVGGVRNRSTTAVAVVVAIVVTIVLTQLLDELVRALR